MRTPQLLLFIGVWSVVLHEAAPQVSIAVNYTPPGDTVLGSNEYRAASSIVLTCLVEGVEGPVTYSWDSTLAAGENPDQRTRSALRSDDTGTHSCNVTEDNVNFDTASIVINVVGAGIYVEIGDGGVPLGALPNNSLIIALSPMETVRLQFFCSSTSMSSDVGVLIGPVTSLAEFFNISTLQVGTLEVVNTDILSSLTSMEQGIYTCRIPNSVGAMVDVNVGIYPSGFNTPLTVTAPTRINSDGGFSISCISSGSPATTVMWLKDGEELVVDGSTIVVLQSISSRTLSRYQNELIVNNLQPDDLLGTYTCVVTNALGSAGMENTLVIRGIQITGNEESLVIGVSANLTCTSDLDVDLIEWLDAEGTVITSSAEAMTLDIIFDPVTFDQQDQQYTCRVTSPYGVQQRTVNVTVTGAMFNFQQLSFTANEDEGVLALCITFSGEIPAMENATLTVLTQDNSATGGMDFEAFSQDLVFNSATSPSDCIATVNLVILQDSTVEGTELFFVILSSSDEFVSLVSSFSAIVSIQDDDVLTASFTEQNFIVNEDVGSVSVCFTAMGDIAIEVSTTVNVTSQAVSAQAPMDYIQVSRVITIESETTGSPICVDATIIDDDVVEREEIFQLILSTMGDEVVLAEPRVANVTILDNDNLTIGFQSTMYEFQEDTVISAQVFIQVFAGVLGPGISAIVSVMAQDGTAISGQDYLFDTITRELQGNVLSITVTIIGDSISEGMENFTLLLDTTDEYVTVTSATAVVVISDNSVLAEVPLSSTVLVGSIAEFRCASNVPVNSLMWRVDGLFITSPQIMGRGFTEETQNVNGTMTTTLFAVGNVSNDGSIIECVVSELDMLQTLSDLASLTVQALRVGFEVSTYTTNEDGQNLTVCIMIENNEFLDDADVITVTVSTSNGSAMVDEDYELNFQMALDILESTGNQICVNVDIIDDELVEGMEEFGLSLSSSDQVVAFIIQTAVVVIEDNDFLTVGFTATNYAVDEDSGSAMFCFTATGNLAPELTAVVSVTSEPITAQAEVDYSQSSQPFTTTFDSESTGSMICVDFNIMDDDLVEGPEVFRLILNTDDDFPVVDPGIANVTINDNDGVTVSMAMNDYTVSENSSTVEVCTEIVVPADGLEYDVVSTLTFSDGSKAIQGTDYSISSPTNTLTVTFSAGSTVSGTTACADVIIIDDNAVEGSHSFTVHVTGLELDPGGVYSELMIGTPPSASINIIDNDGVTVSMAANDYTFSENSSTVEVCAEIVVPAEGLECDVVSTLTFSNGNKAIRDMDYSISSPADTLTFSAGSTVSGTTACVNVTIIDDIAVEGTHSFTVHVTGLELDPGGVYSELSIGTPPYAIVNIMDNDGVTVSMATNGYTFFENSSTVEVCAEIVVPADGLECDVVSTLTFSDGSEAIRDMDYSISSPADTLTVTFSAGSTVSGTTACADVTIIDDDTVEGNHSFTVHVTGLELDPGGVYSELRTGTPVYATVNIIDNDDLTIGFQLTMYAFDEDAGTNAQVAVAVLAGGLGTGITATVSVVAEDGTAMREEDYISNPTTVLVFSPGTTEQTVFFSIIDDTISEGMENFVLLLNTTEEFVSLASTTATVNILDSFDFVEVPMSTSVVVGSTAEFRCTNAIDVPVLFLMWIIDDLDITNQQIIDRGFTEEVQNVDEGIITTTLFALGNTSNNGSRIQCALENTDMLQTISDFAILTVQAVQVGFDANEYNASEDEGSVTVCIQIDNNEILGNDAITVIVSTANGSAAAGEDYQSNFIAEIEITQTFGGQMCANISIFDDELVEDREFFILNLSTADEAVVFTTQLAVVMIENNDVLTVSFTALSYAVNEGDPTATVGIAVTQGTLQSGLRATVMVSTVNGTAEAELDYIPFSEVLRITQESPGGLISLNPFEDVIVEGNEMYQVVLDSLSDFVVVDPSVTTVTILDNDVLTLDFLGGSSAFAVVDENQEQVEVCLFIVSGIIQDMVVVSLMVDVGEGTATVGEDFILPSEPLMFSSGGSVPEQDTDCLTIDIVDDSIEEGDESISLGFSNSEGFLVTPLTATIVIVDDEAVSCGDLLCLNGAACDVESFNCICAPGFTGDDCDIIIVPPPIVTISSFPPSGVPMAGDVYILRCTVIVFEEVLAPIEIYWTDSNGVISNETENVDLELTDRERNATAELMFMALLTSQAGRYSCMAEVFPLSSEGTVMLREEFHLVVRIPSPSLSLFFDTDCIFAGTARFSLSCSLELDENVDTPILAQVQWLPNSIFSNSRVTVEFASQIVDTAFYTSRLVFDPLLFADSINYTCSGLFEPRDDDASNYVDDSGSSDSSDYDSTGVSIYVDASGSVQDSIQLNVEAPPITVEINPAESLRIPNAPPYNQYTVTCNASLPSDIRLQWSFTWLDDTTQDRFSVNESVSITSTVDSGSSASSTLQVIEDRPGTFLPTCLAEVFSIADPELEIIAGESSSSLTVSVTGPSLPVLPEPAVVGVSFELAIIRWISSSVSYTPDVFHIQYIEQETEQEPSVQTSETVMGTQDFLAVNEEYTLILDGLKSDTIYSFQVVASNTEGDVLSEPLNFRTREADAYTLEENNYEVPIGSELRFDAVFNTPFLFDLSLQYTFVPLDHTPLQQPAFISTGLSAVAVSYAQVSPSLTGTYILCRNELGVNRLCGSRIVITVTIPSLTISTNLLVTQLPDNGEVQCLPSDTRAPVQWVNMMGIIPSDVAVVFSPRALNHIAIFDGGSFPDRTEIFVCDFINIDQPDQSINPQRVTVRFIANPVAILNDDRELSPGAVINVFKSLLPSNQPVLNLRCLSIIGHGELQWRTRNVEALPDVIDFETAEQINSLTISYSNNLTRRDGIITYHPLDEQGVGYYACRSEESGYQAEVYTSLDDPIWELVTPTIYDVPLGAEVIISARYADSSVGYINDGAGFSYELRFIPCAILPPEEMVLLSDVTDVSSNIFSYVFPAEFSREGTFQLSATHISSGVLFTDETNVTVFAPTVIEFDPQIFVQYGENATVQCIPNDLRAPVLWVYSSEAEFFFQSYPSVFLLSPPGLNHTATFNATAAVMMFNEESILDPTAVFLLSFRCGFRPDGLVITDTTTDVGEAPYNPIYSEMYIQPDRIRMQYTGRSNFQIFNNTVINALPPPMTTGEAPFNSPLFPRLEVDCNAVQGDELPIWTTDNVITGNASGVVVGDEQGILYGSSVNSDYSTTLFFYIIDPNFNGFYRCRSRRSGLFTEFFLTTENPFIVRVSPAVVTVDEGDPARLEFQIALNSDGNTWNTESISFFFSSNNENDEGRDEVSFLVDSIMFPQNFARNFTSVSREDAGVYITQVFDTTCQFDDSTCFIEENITLNVILYCPSNPDAGILWPRTRQNTVASAPCSQGGSFFREGPLATRRCMENGEWEDVDFTGCTLVESSRPFLLLTLVIEVDEVEGESERLLVMQVSSLLDDYNVPYTDVTLQSAFIASVALTFQVTLDPSVSPQTLLGPLSAFLDFFNNELLALGENFIITPPGSRGIVGVVPSDSCPCVSGVNSSATFLPLCEGTSLSPCDCNEEQCQCQDPFVGDGLSCTLDTDGDGYPDSPLQSCTPESTKIYCIQDICPTVNNPNQDLLECRPNVVITEPEFTGCPYGPDPAWNITWANTERGTTDVQRCPGGVDTLGMATRFCDQNGNWSNPLVLECTSVEFVRIEARAGVIFASFSAGTIGSSELATATAAITLDLTVATETETISLLPSDLNSTNSILSSLLSVLETELEDPDAADGPPDVSLVDVFDNVLEDTNTQGWLELQTVNTGSQVLLDSAERYGLYLARASNDTSSEVILSRPNIVISGRMVDSNSLSVLNDSIVFPQEQHLVNSSGISLTQITIPVGLVRERLINEATTDQSIPVANILFQSLERFLPPSFPGLNNSRGASPVIASQVGSERRTVPSSVLLDTPVSLSFTFEMIEEALEFQCVFWNFSEPVGNGRFISTGVQLIRNTTNGNTTTVLCESTHLTSFAVLVDVTGTLQGISEAERLALQVVSYIGCAISVICLIITIIYFLMQGKKLFNAVHYFVHLNLAISLCLGYLIFLIGIETATSSDGGCAFVAALLHYFFLASFCWMLCEGIMLYLMLVVVFSSLTKKWWFFLLIGYGLPLPAVVIGLAARHDYYGVRVDGELEFCWLSAEKGTIWAFVAPMIVIIMVNVVFLCLVLRSLWKNKKGHKAHKMKEDSEILQLVKTTFKSVVILLPLLGLTWMFGILTLNANSTVFAWFFLIFNSTQGIFILIFHVIRSDKVWSKIGPRLSQLRSTRFQKYRVSRSSVSQSASTSSTFLKGAFRRKQDSDSAAVEMGTLRSNTSVTDNTGTLTFHTGSTIHTEEQSATVVENEGVVDPLPEKVAL